jgi:hypothetical protein
MNVDKNLFFNQKIRTAPSDIFRWGGFVYYINLRDNHLCDMQNCQVIYCHRLFVLIILTGYISLFLFFPIVIRNCTNTPNKLKRKQNRLLKIRLIQCSKFCNIFSSHHKYKAVETYSTKIIAKVHGNIIRILLYSPLKFISLACFLL